MDTVAFLAKNLADFSFGGAFAWYLVKFLISIAVAFAGIKLGIKLRKNKDAKKQPELKGQ